MVDTGASISVFPQSTRTYSGATRSPAGSRLLTAGGESLPCFGNRILPLKFGSRSFQWSFRLAPVTTPILGSDFLKNFSLLVDVAGARVLDADSMDVLSAGSSHTSSTPFCAHLRSAPKEIRRLLADYPDVLSSDGFTASNPKHGVFHDLPTVPGPPVFAKARRLDPEKLASAKAEFAKMEAAGIIRRSSSPWSSPLHMVKKSDGSWRPCGDYRRLNTVTVPDRYPLPSVSDFSARISGSKVFSKLDLQKGYYQVPMRDRDILKTAVVTPFGLFEFLRLPFGLRNAAQTFQRMMDNIFGDLPFCFIYLDDILVYSPDLVSHQDHLQQVLQLCRDHGLTINLDKCVFAVDQVEFLGHLVSASGSAPLQKHCSAISQFPRPVDRPSLQRFLGMINFYRKFIHQAAKILHPLTSALKGSPKNFSWNSAMERSFSDAKSALLQVPSLVHPVPSAPISLAVDASESHVGAVLQQKISSSWAPLAFFSKKLSDPETRYSAFDRELLAAYSAIRHFRFLLEGRQFTLFTDHKPLTHALFRVSPPWSARQQRQLSYISEFTSSIQHLPGSDNIVADALSRPIGIPVVAAPVPCSEVSVSPVLSVSSGTQDQGLVSPTPAQLIDYSNLAQLQKQCLETQALISSSVLNVQLVPFSAELVLCDLSTGVPRPLVPVPLRKTLFLQLHGLSHPGVRASRRLISQHFVWKNLSKDVGLWARSCIPCQKSKVQIHTRSNIPSIPVPNRRFSHLHVDLVGPLPVSGGFNYLFTMIDRTTRWPEIVPLSSISAASCAQALLSGWVSRFGVPSVLTSDRGTQFTSSLWKEFCLLLGISHTKTTSFHPQSNGIIERFHRSLKSSLRSKLAGSGWIHHLPLVLLGLRSAPKDDHACSSAEAVYGSPLMLPGMFLDAPEFPSEKFKSRIQSVLQSFSSPPSHHVHAAAPVVPLSLKTATHVFVREDATTPPLHPLYRGPYLVLERGDKYFTLQLGAASDKVSIDRLKAVISSEVIVPQVPPARGRPRRAPPDSSPPLSPPPRVRFVSPPSPPRPPPSALSSLPSAPVPRRNPHRKARQPSTASSSRPPRR